MEDCRAVSRPIGACAGTHVIARAIPIFVTPDLIRGPAAFLCAIDRVSERPMKIPSSVHRSWIAVRVTHKIATNSKRGPSVGARRERPAPAAHEA